MSAPKTPEPALLILSILSMDPDAPSPELARELEALFGPVAHRSPALAFGYTSYYDRELGSPLFRRLLGFERLAPQDALAGAKLATNALETRYARPDGRRRVNLDPGLVTQERLVLATGKNFTHRVYLRDGIFADLTLVYQKGAWRGLPWTFPDYAAPETQEHLNRLRDILREKLRQHDTSGAKDRAPW